MLAGLGGQFVSHVSRASFSRAPWNPLPPRTFGPPPSNIESTPWSAGGYGSRLSVVKTPDTSDEEEEYRCSYPGCSSTGTFKRKYELQRHEKKHDESQQQRCLGLGCNKHFYRLDKLWDHIRASRHAAFECPAPHCSMSFPSLDEVLVHFSGHPDAVKNVYRSLFGLEYIEEHVHELFKYPIESGTSNYAGLETGSSHDSLNNESSSLASDSVREDWGGRFPCLEPGCQKTYKTKSGVTYGTIPCMK
jgi:hypothetical protein